MKRILGDKETQNETERKLRMRLGGLTQAVGEMEPGQREFCLAAIDDWLDYMVTLREENESLLDANISIRRDLQTSWEEKARLREENESYRVAFEEELECCKERGEQIERLRERGDWAVEQLRLAEAAGEELREQLSLNRVHDRDCVAREAELTRLREENERLRKEYNVLETNGFPGTAEDWLRLRRIEEAAIWVINPNGSPYVNRAAAIVALEAVLRAALADQPTEEKLTPSQELMYAEDGYDQPTEEEA